MVPILQLGKDRSTPWLNWGDMQSVVGVEDRGASIEVGGGAVGEFCGGGVIKGCRARDSLSGGATLVVDLKEADSSSISPLDSLAGSTSWDTGSANAQMSGSSDGNAHSGFHQSAELRVGEAPLMV